jgi:hypothetical protein
MSPLEFRASGMGAGIPCRLVCIRARINRSRPSKIETGLVEPSTGEMQRLEEALSKLIEARSKVLETAVTVGWPAERL